jgi:hypothetical protein
MLRVQVLGNPSVLDPIVNPPYFATFDSSQIQLQHYHFLFTADNNISTLQFANLGFDNFDADVIVDTVSVAPSAPSMFSNWQTSHFTMDQLNDPLISGWAADPDFDRVANGLEFFFNTNPLSGIPEVESGSMPKPSIEQSNGSFYLTYSFRQLLNWSGNPPVVGVSNDLVTWDETGSQIEQVSVTPTGDGVTEIVKVRLKTPIDQITMPPRKFLRLSLTD